jgi:hypothetical protein
MLSAFQLDQGHRITCLKLLDSILERSREKISKDLGQDLVDFATKEMVAIKEVEQDVQQPASNILVQLAGTFPNEVEIVISFFSGVLVWHLSCFSSPAGY